MSWPADVQLAGKPIGVVVEGLEVEADRKTLFFRVPGDSNLDELAAELLRMEVSLSNHEKFAVAVEKTGSGQPDRNWRFLDPALEANRRKTLQVLLNNHIRPDAKVFRGFDRRYLPSRDTIGPNPYSKWAVLLNEYDNPRTYSSSEQEAPGLNVSTKIGSYGEIGDGVKIEMNLRDLINLPGARVFRDIYATGAEGAIFVSFPTGTRVPFRVIKATGNN